LRFSLLNETLAKRIEAMSRKAIKIMNYLAFIDILGERCAGNKGFSKFFVWGNMIRYVESPRCLLELHIPRMFLDRAVHSGLEGRQVLNDFSRVERSDSRISKVSAYDGDQSHSVCSKLAG